MDGSAASPRSVRVVSHEARPGPPRGYDLRVEAIRQNDLARLDEKGIVYLDYAGAALYTLTQVNEYKASLEQHLLCNPHSGGFLGNEARHVIERAREQVLRFTAVDPSTHAVVFTAGSTAALKLVGECFDWSTSSEFSYTQLNHNSVLGIREYAIERGATAVCVGVDAQARKTVLEVVKHPVSALETDSPKTSSNCLFAYPAECNFSGIRLPLRWVDDAREGHFSSSQHRETQRWFVLLDAAKFCATTPLDLLKVEADFTCLSFYKMFGLPTGLGALIVRRQAVSVLNSKPYFGGGTVEACSSDRRFHRLKKRFEERLEDGTVSFAAILSLAGGFDLLQNRLGMQSISLHTSGLAQWTASEMQSLRHGNGASVCHLFGRWHDSPLGVVEYPAGTGQGPTIAFMLRSAANDIIGHSAVERLASSCRIQLRSGRFCNPGACQLFLSISADDLETMFHFGHVCGDDIDMVDGKPTGCLRISLGFGTTFEDVWRWISFLREYIVDADEGNSLVQASVTDTSSGRHVYHDQWPRVSQLLLYPIKSCGAFEVQTWPLTRSAGFLYDREFALVNSRGSLLTQKHCPRMCLLRPHIDLESEELVVSCSEASNSIRIHLKTPPKDAGHVSTIKLCGSRCSGILMEEHHHQWFSLALGLQCQLVRFAQVESATNRCLRDTSIVGFANEGQLLVVNIESVHKINPLWDAAKFRPNIVVCRSPPFAEENWKDIDIGEIRLHVDKLCTRCSMVDVNQSSAQIGNRVFADLVKARKKPKFGILVSRAPERTSPKSLNLVRYISVNDQLRVSCRD